MDLGAHVRFDHQLLAVERDHHVHCMLELTAPSAVASTTRPPPAPCRRTSPSLSTDRVDGGTEARYRSRVRRLPGTAAHELRVPLTVNLVSADEAAGSGADHEVT